MTYVQIFNTIVGIGFLSGGFLLIKNSKGMGVLSILVGLWVMNNVLFGAISKSDEKQKEIIELRLESIEQIEILPIKNEQVLTEDTVLIKSEIEIRRIQDCLSKSKETLNANQRVDWRCVLKIQKEDEEIVLSQVSKNGDRTHLELYSNGSDGINYGTMVNNELGFLIEEIIRNKKANHN